MFAAVCTLDESPDYDLPEEPQIYQQDIDVIITKIDKRHWFAKTHWYKVDVTVKNEEYQIEETKTFKGSGMFIPDMWYAEEGDIVQAVLTRRILNSTGEVVQQYIQILE